MVKLQDWTADTDIESQGDRYYKRGSSSPLSFLPHFLMLLLLLGTLIAFSPSIHSLRARAGVPFLPPRSSSPTPLTPSFSLSHLRGSFPPRFNAIINGTAKVEQVGVLTHNTTPSLSASCLVIRFLLPSRSPFQGREDAVEIPFCTILRESVCWRASWEVF